MAEVTTGNAREPIDIIRIFLADFGAYSRAEADRRRLGLIPLEQTLSCGEQQSGRLGLALGQILEPLHPLPIVRSGKLGADSNGRAF